MDFSKLKTEVEALLVAKAEPAVEDTTPMTAEQFAAYASEQVTKAQAEADAGDIEVATTRVTALATEVDKVTKFEFKPGELPAVSIFKDPFQKSPEVLATPAGESTPAASNWVAKASEFGSLIGAALDSLKPAAAPTVDAPAVSQAEFKWPSDLATAAPADELRDFKATA